MKKLIKFSTSTLLILSLILCLTFSVSASQSGECDTEKTGSIVIDYRYDDTPLDDIEFKVYHITTLTKNNKHIINDKYKNADIKFDKINDENCWTTCCDNLENFINYENIKPEKIFYTDNAGNYRLEDLELGIYFIQAAPIIDNGLEIFSNPTIISVGHYDDDKDKWIYDYKVSPKLSVLNNESYDISVKKVWKNTNSELLLPKEIKIELNCNGEKYDVVTLSKENNWSYTWKDIAPCCTWGVKELDKLENFEVNYSKDLFSFTITNTYTGPSDEELPQTGSLAYLIPIFAGFGIILILVGVLLKYKIRYK